MPTNNKNTYFVYKYFNKLYSSNELIAGKYNNLLKQSSKTAMYLTSRNFRLYQNSNLEFLRRPIQKGPRFTRARDERAWRVCQDFLRDFFSTILL